MLFPRSITLLLLLVCHSFFGQEKTAESLISALEIKEIDSLDLALKTAKEDTNKVNTLHLLCIKLQNTGDFNAALKAEEQTLILSEKLNWKKGMAKAYNSIGCIYLYQGNYKLALKNHFASKALYEKLGEKGRLAANYHNIGMVYNDQGSYPEALKNFFTALKINEETGNKVWKGNNLNYIGIVYQNQHNTAQSLKYYEAALKIKEELGDKKGIADAYNNIGDIYFELNNYPEAMRSHDTSLNIRKEIGDKTGIGTSLGNIGQILTMQAQLISDPAKKQKLLNDALKNEFDSKKIFTELKDVARLAAIEGNIGLVYIELKNYKEAAVFYLSSLALAQKMGHLNLIQSANQRLSDIYNATGQYEQALKAYKAYISTKDILFNEENTKKTVQLEMQYAFDKKEAEGKLEQEKKEAVTAAESKKQKIILISVCGILVIVLFFAIFAYRSYLQKQKANVEISRQKKMIEEKQKEILDSIHYAKRIQVALLPNTKYIEKNLNKN